MPALRELIEQTTEVMVAEQATGCRGAGDYRQWAAAQGYPHLAVLDWTSSAGDWAFIVSKDGYEWFVMSQTNNWPRPGFERSVDTQPFYGTEEEVLQEVCDFY